MNEHRCELGLEDLIQAGDYHEWPTDEHGIDRLPVSHIWIGFRVKDTHTGSRIFRPDPQEAPEARGKETAMHALESLTPGGSEFYQDVARCKEWIQDRINTNWELAKKAKMEANEYKSAASKMAEALGSLIYVVEDYSADQSYADDPRCGLVQPIDVETGNKLNIALVTGRAALADYYKAVGK
jgi:hypothetical protein